MDTFTTLWNRALLRVPAASPDLCQDLIRDSFNQLMERRPWSWLQKTGTFYPVTYPATGTASLISGSAVVSGSGTAFTSNMVSVQIRIGGLSYPTYTIAQVASPTSLVLDRPWVGPTASGQSMQIFTCYFTVPSDFDYFYSVTNPTANYRLNFNATQADLDAYDPQRSQFGQAFALAFYDNTNNSQGVIAPAIQIIGSGAAPISTTEFGYSYPQDSIYTVRITTGGVSGVAEFSWEQDAGTTSGTAVVSDPSPIGLSNGVEVYFPAGTYVLGDTFVIRCSSDTTSGLARYEMWPRPFSTPYAYPYLYAAKLSALSDLQPQLPQRIARRGDVLLEMTLAQLSLWPGTQDQPNPYASPVTAGIHSTKAEKMLYELEKQDEEVSMKDLIYTLPFQGPWRDGSWLQTHAMYE